MLRYRGTEEGTETDSSLRTRRVTPGRMQRCLHFSYTPSSLQYPSPRSR